MERKNCQCLRESDNGLSPKESKNVSLDAIEVHALFSDILERDALLQVPQVLNEGDNILNQISAINVR